MPVSSTPPPVITTSDLARLPLFAGVATPDLRRLLEAAPAVAYRDGEFMMHEGERAGNGLLIVSGTARVQTYSGKQTRTLNTIEAGKIVGESGLLVQEEVRSASMVATSLVHALVLTRSTLKRLAGTSVLASIQIEMLNESAVRLRRTQETMLRLAVRPPPAKPPPECSAPKTQKKSAWKAFLKAFGGLA